MAMTYLEEQKKKQQEQLNQQATTPYNLQGTSAATQSQLQKAQTGYQPNTQTQAAQQSLQAVQSQRPQTYSSKYGAQLDNILNEIQNPKSFKYSFNDDELFKSYADVLTQNAKQASLNAQGQAAALTGGYGNSYGLAAGQQAYQQALLPLYDRGMELAQFARDNYDKAQADKYNQLAALQGMEGTDYERYRDTMADWRTDLQNAQDVYNTERSFGYNEYADALANAMNLANMETSSYRADQDEAYRRDTMAQDQAQFEATNKLDWANLEEKQRQFDAELSEEQRQYNQNYAMNLCGSILANGQIPSNELLVAAGLSMEDAQKLVAQLVSGSGADGGKTTPTIKGSVKGIVNDTASDIKETMKDIVYSAGNGIASALQNYKGYGQLGDDQLAIALGYTKSKANGQQYTANERAAAQDAARELYGLSLVEDKNDAAVDAYVRSLIANGTLGTNKESMEKEIERQKKYKTTGTNK